MNKVKIFLLGLVAIGLIVGFVYFVAGYFKPKGAGVFIKTEPASSVYIDDELLGRTPYRVTRKAGEVVIKLVPDSFETPLVPYETKIALVSGVETVIDWEFGSSDETSSGQIVSFEKIGDAEVSLSAVTIPDSAGIKIDEGPQEVSPFKTTDIDSGEHTLLVNKEGFKERKIEAKTYPGYKLTAIVKLSPNVSGTAIIEATPTLSQKQKKVMVEILETGVGFLRVRKEPSTLGEELAKVKPGDIFPLLDEDEETGWFKIEYEVEKEGIAKAGWVSNTYARKVEEDLEVLESKNATQSAAPAALTPTPTAR